jgi:rhodanese-related sulfurtransferase
MQNNDITKASLNQMVNQGAILLDVRSRQEYREGHLNNAIQIADFELRDKAEYLLKDKNATIIVYCQSGNRSRNACNLLKCMGYKNVYNLYGGLNEM